MLAHFSVAPEAPRVGEKAPALTVSQVRTLLEVVLPLRTSTVEGVLEFIAWVQQRNRKRIERIGRDDKRTDEAREREIFYYINNCCSK